ncbi:hypothetical protein RchiOBHm_Chr4g0399521 [Rosa chinensis]|uniref:Uncharacterized protein n=1 Tax=Rosa chinensis TaxID=74649 RepID=A0A2P6QSL0_ROSCH|nr:hypothetical protein RchiOBHm_Chr4g0399521 [Rosa chinensis]
MAVVAEIVHGTPKLQLVRRPLHQSPIKITLKMEKQKKKEDLNTDISSSPQYKYAP